MIKYRPKSWSQQAREMADKQFATYVAANECGDPESWLLDPKLRLWEEEHYLHFFSNSYRAPIIRQRAAKRFGRLVRKYKNQVRR